MTKSEILAQAMSLDPVERQDLAEQLMFSLTDAERDRVDAAWLAEAKRRDAAMARGELKTTSVDDAVARVLSRSRA